MLQTLTVKNLALLVGLELDMPAAFTALTGETGAGKSLLLDALSLLLGGRAEASLIRHGEGQAEVAGRFVPVNNSPLLQVLADNGLGLEADGTLLLRRQLKKADEKSCTSKAWVNGVPVPLTVLGAVGDCLADIQGQHSAPGLLQPARQREVLDATGRLGAQGAAVATSHTALQQAQAAAQAANSQLAAAEAEATSSAQNLKLLQQLNYVPGEELTLQQQRQRLQHGSQIAAQLLAADEALNMEKGAITALQTAAKQVGVAARLDETLAPLAAQLAACMETAADIGHTLARATQAEPEGSLESIDDRLHALKSMARTLGCELAALPAQAELLTGQSQNMAALEAAARTAALAETNAYNTFTAACKALTVGRNSAATQLAPQLQNALRALLLPHAEIAVKLTPLPEAAWNASGAETVELLLAANPGSPMQPIQKVASGGELARLLLALKQVLYAALPPQLLVLDEVDTGLSGAAASAVGAAMAALGARHQVLAVTHHAQVAARAANHGKLAKQVAGGTTSTQLNWLSGEARQEELARLLAGAKMTPEARAAAAALLAEAQAAPHASAAA